MSMKKLLVSIVLGTVPATPAFAQHDPNATRRGRTSETQRPSTVPPGGINYFKRSPHHQSGESRSKRKATKSGRRI
jgi:hypothetical protein